jgi:hypothetical protein
VLCTELADCLRNKAVTYRKLAEQADHPVVKNEMLELAPSIGRIACNRPWVQTFTMERTMSSPGLFAAQGGPTCQVVAGESAGVADCQIQESSLKETPLDARTLPCCMGGVRLLLAAIRAAVVADAETRG